MYSSVYLCVLCMRTFKVRPLMWMLVDSLHYVCECVTLPLMQCIRHSSASCSSPKQPVCHSNTHPQHPDDYFMMFYFGTKACMSNRVAAVHCLPRTTHYKTQEVRLKMVWSFYFVLSSKQNKINEVFYMHLIFNMDQILVCSYVKPIIPLS